MTFDQWFAQSFPSGYSPDGSTDVLPMRDYMAQAWHEAQKLGCAYVSCHRVRLNRVEELQALINRQGVMP